LIGFTLVFIAVVGMSLYTEPVRDVPRAKRYLVEFPKSTMTGASGQGDTPDGSSGTATVSLNQTNITSVVFMFSFTDNYRLSSISPAGASVKITSPDGAEQTANLPASGPTSAALTFKEVCPLPQEATITAMTLNEAQKKAQSKFPTTENGTGDWTVEVTAARTYKSPVHSSGSISWTVSSRVESYHAEVSEYLR